MFLLDSMSNCVLIVWFCVDGVLWPWKPHSGALHYSVVGRICPEMIQRQICSPEETVLRSVDLTNLYHGTVGKGLDPTDLVINRTDAG